MREFKTHKDYRDEYCPYKGSVITFPYSITIRSSKNGMIWQYYIIKNHTDRIHEDSIVLNAYTKAYEDIRIEKTILDCEETYPKWREEVTKVKVIK